MVKGLVRHIALGEVNPSLNKMFCSLCTQSYCNYIYDTGRIKNVF